MSTQTPAPGPHYETTPPVAPTEDSVGGQPAGRPVGHEGTRVEITERKAWSVGGLPTLLILLLLILILLPGIFLRILIRILLRIFLMECMNLIRYLRIR